MLITPEYAELNRQLHASNAQYGGHGDEWAANVEKVAGLLNTTNILDYGCGKGSLAKALPNLPIREYDPCIIGKDATPHPADLVVCTDVLEHVEPDLLQGVIDHLRALTNRLILLAVHTGPAAKVLPDGRNAHLSQHPPQFWIEQANRRFVIVQMQLIGRTVFILAHTQAEHERAMSHAANHAD